MQIVSGLITNLNNFDFAVLACLFFLWAGRPLFTLLIWIKRPSVFRRPFRSILFAHIQAPIYLKALEKIILVSGEILSLFLDIILYLTIRFTVLPKMTRFAYALIIALIVKRIATTISPFLYDHYFRVTSLSESNNTEKNKAIVYVFLQQTVGIITYAGFILIVALAFVGAVRLSDTLTINADFDKHLKKTDSELNSLVADASKLQNSLNGIIAETKNTQIGTSALLKSLDTLHTSIADLKVERSKLESRIKSLESKSENDIKSEATYRVVSELLSSGSLKNTFIGFVVGFLASVLANYLTTRSALVPQDKVHDYPRSDKEDK